MRLEAPHYLGCLLVIPFLLLLSMRAWQSSNRWLMIFSGERRPLLPSLLSLSCVCLAMASLTLSLCGPEIQYERNCPSRTEIEFVIGIDVSKSMLAEDAAFPVMGRSVFSPLNRLNRARHFARELLSQLPGQKVGVFIFAGKGIEIVPLTADHGYCRYVLTHLNDADVTRGGSDLGEALRTGLGMLETSRGKGARFMVMLSDGEDVEPDRSSLYESARDAVEKGIIVHAVGVGTPKPVLIPIRSERGASVSDHYADEEGAYLTTALMEETLKSISDITAGHYFRMSDESVPKKLAEDMLRKVRKAEGSMGREVAWLNLSPVFLGLGLFFLILGELF